jgi:hypothetical protein
MLNVRRTTSKIILLVAAVKAQEGECTTTVDCDAFCQAKYEGTRDRYETATGRCTQTSASPAASPAKELPAGLDCGLHGVFDPEFSLCLCDSDYRGLYCQEYAPETSSYEVKLKLAQSKTLQKVQTSQLQLAYLLMAVLALFNFCLCCLSLKKRKQST